MPATMVANNALVERAVLVHHEALRRLSRVFHRVSAGHRLGLVPGESGTSCAHALETGMFAFRCRRMLSADCLGRLACNFKSGMTSPAVGRLAGPGSQ